MLDVWSDVGQGLISNKLTQTIIAVMYSNDFTPALVAYIGCGEVLGINEPVH